MCFYEDIPRGNESYLFEYRVIRGGNYDVDASMETPDGKDNIIHVRSSDAFARALRHHASQWLEPIIHSVFQTRISRTFGPNFRLRF